jgi:endonuclease/exonuclease/phosphatase family metal-dependent hydrolase
VNASGTLRVCTLNLWGVTPPVPLRFDLAIRQLAALDLDAIGLQEVVALPGQTGTSADLLAAALGMEVAYAPACSHPGGEEGLAVLSRRPIAARRVFPLPDRRPTEARILLSTCLETSVGPVWFHTTHLHYRLDDGLARERQVVAVDDALRSLAGDPHILCGDFNATPDADEMRFLRGLTTLAGRRTHYQDAWLRCRSDDPGLTWSAQNPEVRAQRTLDVDRRIDYIFVSSRHKDGRGTVLDARVVLTERDPGSGSPASDHYGVLAEVQLVPSAEIASPRSA